MLPRGREFVCIEMTPDQKYNTSILSMDGSIDMSDNRLDESTKRLVLENKTKFEMMARSVGRVHSTTGVMSGSGVIFAVAPGI